VPILEVLQIVSQTVGNVIMEKAIKTASADIERGESISAALGKHPVFPSMIIRMITAGEQTGKIDNMLERISDFLDEEIETTLSGLTSLIVRSDVIIATESSIVCRNFERIITRTRAHNIPVAATMPDSAEKGALVSLEISPQEQGHLAADIAVRLLEGATPDHLTLLTPRRVDLIVNMRIAREMGFNLPFQVLGNATRVIR